MRWKDRFQREGREIKKSEIGEMKKRIADKIGNGKREQAPQEATISEEDK